ncbi:hypothetical protein SAMN06265379_110127 [Saccharicrinis carchari]|uniref:Uncharacterized protein n=1 Tax=Saccharicrinis carchari TaxID=1168039 RepID=A0A521ER33_SACCC|nr:hypothetical protein [Saccharicrinis carchari]SMO86367.1 hypothetical protein SAMN06265379_110127 [Saccharicrinis carchari]
MKKIVLIMAVAGLFIALGMSSCKSTEDCPAYSKVIVEKDTENA